MCCENGNIAPVLMKFDMDGKDFLIIEWKSGDYRWGDFPTDYYVFVRG